MTSLVISTNTKNGKSIPKNLSTSYVVWIRKTVKPRIKLKFRSILPTFRILICYSLRRSTSNKTIIKEFSEIQGKIPSLHWSALWMFASLDEWMKTLIEIGLSIDSFQFLYCYEICSRFRNGNMKNIIFLTNSRQSPWYLKMTISENTWSRFASEFKIQFLS